MSTQNLGTAVITGASSGIGEVYAERLAERGYDLILVARNAERLSSLAARLGASHDRKIDILPADLTLPGGIGVVEERLRSDDSVTLLVNNAGLMAGGPLAESDPGAVDAMLQVNVVALTRLSAAAAAHFSTRKRGGIINIGSAMAYLDTPRTAAYGASKAYVLNFSLSLDLELGPLGVQVQAVLPGYTRTPMIDNGQNLPDAIVMDVDALVDAALAGYDARELVTIPSLPDVADYEAWEASRAALRPNLSLSKPADRYGVSAASR